MSKIKDAINQIPSWPGFAIGAVVMLSIGGWYYGKTYANCMEVRDGRNELHGAIKAAAAGQGGVLDLAKALDGDWDELRIVQGHRPGQVPLNCPFGWDLGWRERQDLIEAGQYTIVGLFKAGTFQRYIEYRGDWATFRGAINSIPRSRARFDVTGTVQQPYAVTLKP
jgi:hypothetical protein